MESPTPEDFEELTARVAQLERLLRAQAAYHSELLAFAPPTASKPGDDEILLTTAEAAEYLTIGESTFRKRRDKVGLKPRTKVSGRFPRYAKSDLDRIRSLI